MMEYKVCFHMSYLGFDGKRYHGKLHYCGRTLEEAVRKVALKKLAVLEATGRAVCTSMWIMRGREKGKNIKWKDYEMGDDLKKEYQRQVMEWADFLGARRR